MSEHFQPSHKLVILSPVARIIEIILLVNMASINGTDLDDWKTCFEETEKRHTAEGRAGPPLSSCSSLVTLRTALQANRIQARLC